MGAVEGCERGCDVGGRPGMVVKWRGSKVSVERRDQMGLVVLTSRVTSSKAVMCVDDNMAVSG